MTEESLSRSGKVPLEKDKLKSFESTVEIFSFSIWSTGVDMLLGSVALHLFILEINRDISCVSVGEIKIECKLGNFKYFV